MMSYGPMDNLLCQSHQGMRLAGVLADWLHRFWVQRLVVQPYRATDSNRMLWQVVKVLRWVAQNCSKLDDLEIRRLKTFLQTFKKIIVMYQCIYVITIQYLPFIISIFYLIFSFNRSLTPYRSAVALSLPPPCDRWLGFQEPITWIGAWTFSHRVAKLDLGAQGELSWVGWKLTPPWCPRLFFFGGGGRDLGGGSKFGWGISMSRQ